MLINITLQIVRGFLMGCADVVPGVSGGTVALMVGIYHRLVANIRAGARALIPLARFDLGEVGARLRAVEWAFLLPLLAGIAAAVLTLASVIQHLLETQPIPMAGLFCGLVLASVVVAARLVRPWEPKLVALALGVGVAMFVGLGFGAGTLSDPPLWFFFFAGAVAICAMILPGVSGSFLLLMVGMYDPVLSAVSDRDLVTAAVFAAGCLVGLAAFSQVLHWALVHHERPVVAVLVGLLLGSLRILWPWPNGVGSEEGTDGTVLALPSDPVVWPIVLAVIGFVAVLVITAVAERLEHRNDDDLARELRTP